MILIELAIGAGAVALTVAAARAISRRRQRSEGSPERPADGERSASRESRSGGGPVGDGEVSAEDELTHAVPASPRPARPRGLRLDDVLLYADDEMWLAGEIYLHEEGFALALFVTPGSPRSEWVVQLEPEAHELLLLSPTEEVPGGTVPSELPIGGMRLSLRRRGHADVHVAGDHLPLTTERARYTVLGGPGGRVLVVVDFEGGDRLALLGESVHREMLDLLPGGG